jgi:hypothetical protein
MCKSNYVLKESIYVSLFKSVFKDYKPDNPQKLEECFEFDWSCSKIEKVIKGEEEIAQSKEYIRSNYKWM